MFKRTVLYERHIALGGKMVAYAKFELPIQYTRIIEEHNAVRNKCGIFDVSHMGEIIITGEKAFDFIQYIVTNDISGMEIGSARYSPMCYENGGCVDDIIIYKFANDEYMLVVNAANLDKDYEWIKQNRKFDIEAINFSDKLSQIAIQGPMSKEIISKVFKQLPDKYYSFVDFIFEDCKKRVIISRTGYTGEDGYEIYALNEVILKIWDELMVKGADDIIPCGLGARDTLRLEAGMPLYGHEISQDISPLEAGLNRFVSLDKECDFIGKEALTNQKQKGLRRRKCSIELIDKGIAREGALIAIDDMQIGYVTSGTKSITLGKSIAMAMIKKPYNKIGTLLQVNVRNREINAKVIRGPFYKKR